jgi:hypothetical protein
MVGSFNFRLVFKCSSHLSSFDGAAGNPVTSSRTSANHGAESGKTTRPLSPSGDTACAQLTLSPCGSAGSIGIPNIF